MRKMSKAAKAEAYDGVVAARDLWHEVAHILVGEEKIAAREVIDQSTSLSDKYATLDDGEVHEFRLYRATWAHGGVMVYVHQLKGQHPSVNAEYFERWIERMHDTPYGIGLGTEIKIACERLQQKRRELFENFARVQSE